MKFQQKILVTAIAMSFSGMVAAQTVVATKITQQREDRIVSSGAPTVTISHNSDSRTLIRPDGSTVIERYRLTYTITRTPVTKVVTTYRVETQTLSNRRTNVIRTPISSQTITTTDQTTRTARELIGTEVVSAPTKPITPTVIGQPTLDFDPKTYEHRTYYGNNPNLGMPTAVPSHDPRYYIGAETNKSVSVSNANYAYARGWTGQGSTIMIMDSGIDVKNRDFAGKIKYQIDYTRTGIQDTNGHGTHVAGIAAGARNGTGTHGVAFDANLAIAKITTGTAVSMTAAQSALQWAGQYSDIVVASLSANVNYSTDYRSAMKQVSPGVFVNNHATYGGQYYYNRENPHQWATSLPKEMVLTVSAGNTNDGYVQNPATFATATDANGNLLMGGRMLVVGNWNDGGARVEGARAGHVCKDYRNNTCYDRYQTKDFYILAPGSGIVSTGINDTTKSMSGTSQAAPAVAGAVAIVNQMWPYMKGDQTVQLLLKTANKNLPGYSAETHGAGLLDLDRATRPIGTLGISTTGRTGRAQPISGSISLPGINNTVTGALSSVAAVDEFQRDFSVNLSGMVQKNAIIQNPLMLDHEPGQSWSAKYAGVATTRFQGFALGQINKNSSISLNSRLFGQPTPWSHQVTVTQTEINPYVQFSGSWGSVTGATTLEYDSTYRDTKSGRWAQAGVLQTTTQFSPGMVTGVTPIYAVHAVAGQRFGDFDLYAGIKPYVVSGAVNITVPTAVDTNGTMHYSTVKANLAGGNPTSYAGVNWASNFRKTHAMMIRATVAQDGTYYAGTNYSYRF
jgi:subtilisin family serine protease